MSANSYFTLTTSDGLVSKKFGVVQAGYEPAIEKQQNIQTTIDGGMDVSLGGIYETHTYLVRIRHTESREGYGTKADLEMFYRLNNPNAAITPVIRLTDHFGEDHNVYMIGQHVPIPLSVTIEGMDAWFNLKCTFRFIPEA